MASLRVSISSQEIATSPPLVACTTLFSNIQDCKRAMQSPGEDSTSLSPEAVAFTLWGNTAGNTRSCDGDLTTNSSHDAYMKYYHLQQSYFAHLRGRSYFIDFKSVAEIARLLRENEIREGALTLLKSGHINELNGCLGDEKYGHALNLTARLLSMTSIGRLQHEVNPRRYLNWEPQLTLRECLSANFNKSHEMRWERTRLPLSFDAWGLSAVAGITLRFTDNLADHLLLVEDDTMLFVFHHATFLKQQTNESILPPDLALETLKTLAMLFPQSAYARLRRGERHKQQWFSKLRQNYEQKSGSILDKNLIKCGTLDVRSRQIEQFEFWRDRLVILKQAHDDATPRTLPQWWHDRRNGVQWYTFWVAILVLVLTVVFGLIQCIEGGLQVYKAYHP